MYQYSTSKIPKPTRTKIPLVKYINQLMWGTVPSTVVLSKGSTSTWLPKSQLVSPLDFANFPWLLQFFLSNATDIDNDNTDIMIIMLSIILKAIYIFLKIFDNQGKG